MRTKVVGIVSHLVMIDKFVDEMEDMLEEAEKAEKNKSASKESFVCSIDYLLP